MPEFHLDTSGTVPVHNPNPAHYATEADAELAKEMRLTADEVRADRAADDYLEWRDLDAFTQGYIEDLFFTETSSSMGKAEWLKKSSKPGFDPGDSLPNDAGFADLSPEALADIIADCAKFLLARPGFQSDAADAIDAALERSAEDVTDGLRRAGRDFWYTRNGHGCGFWDGDWPEPYATQLTEASKAFPEVDVYLGDDGKVYLS